VAELRYCPGKPRNTSLISGDLHEVPTEGSTALVDVGRVFTFLNYTAGRTPWSGDQPVARPLPTRRTTQTQSKRTQTSILRVGFELTIPVFERAKIVHVLYRATTVIGLDQTSQ
jgi:hypothetical protein